MNYKHSLGNFNNKEIKKVFNTDERVCIDCNENIEDTPSFAFDAAPGPTRAYLTCPNCKTEYTVKKEKLTELYIDIFEYQ